MEAICKECGAVYSIEGAEVPVSMTCLCKSNEFKISESPMIVLAK